VTIIVKERSPIRHPHYTDDFFAGNELEYLINEQERIAVGENFFDIGSMENDAHD
jgi:hypothetical protein